MASCCCIHLWHLYPELGHTRYHHSLWWGGNGLTQRSRDLDLFSKWSRWSKIHNQFGDVGFSSVLAKGGRRTQQVIRQFALRSLCWQQLNELPPHYSPINWPVCRISCASKTDTHTKNKSTVKFSHKQGVRTSLRSSQGHVLTVRSRVTASHAKLLPSF